jgi:sulfite reductase alpha subunit-like flavoprotein
MIHINRSKDKKFYVTVVAENGEILSTSETLNSKQAAWKNIDAQWEAFAGMFSIDVMDNSFKNPKNIVLNKE